MPETTPPDPARRRSNACPEPRPWSTSTSPSSSSTWPRGRPEAFEQAAAIYTGDLLSGFSLSEPLFEDWLVPERERLRELALEAIAKLLAWQRATGATERAIQTAVRLLALDPLQEAVHRTLMRLYLVSNAGAPR